MSEAATGSGRQRAILDSERAAGGQKRTEKVDIGLCRARDRVTIDQQLKYGAKCSRSPGAAIEHPQFVRLLYSQRLHYRKRRMIDRIWIAPDDFHDSLPCLKNSGTCEARSSKCQYGDILPDSHLVTSLTLTWLEPSSRINTRLLCTRTSIRSFAGRKSERMLCSN